MNSFEEMDLSPEVVEALALNGFERPTPFQEGAIPVVRRGNNLLGQAGPGAGTLVAYGAALLDRLDPGASSPGAIVVVPSQASADRLARSLGRIARETGHRVSALAPGWALPGTSDILFGDLRSLLTALRESVVKAEDVRILVVEQAHAVLSAGGDESMEALSAYLGALEQRVFLSQPFTDDLSAFCERHVRRGVHVPPRAATREGSPARAPRRGTVQFAADPGRREDRLADHVERMLRDGLNHVVVHCASDDEAADVGDDLELHGLLAGQIGDAQVPVWLSTDELECRKLLDGREDEETIGTVSFTVPAGADTLDRRHGAGASGLVLLDPREVPHLRSIAREAGYELTPAPTLRPASVDSSLEGMIGRIESRLEAGVLGPWFLALEGLFDRFSPAEVAAAAVALLNEQIPPATGPRPSAPPPPEAWARLFIGVGGRDGIRPGDLVGAVTGETTVSGDQLGRIDVRDSYSIMEVHQTVAETIIQALNGTTIRGRSARVDYDRGDRRPASDRKGMERRGTDRRGGERRPGDRRPRSDAPRGPRRPRDE